MRVASIRRRYFLQAVACVVGVIGFTAQAAAASELFGFRMVQQENVMLHFDLDQAAVGANLFSLTEPDRLVIDLPNTRLATSLPAESFASGVVKSIRYGVHESQHLRIVLDLRRAISPSFRFVNRQNGQRLLVDLGVKGSPELDDASHKITQTGPLRDVFIAIDAGHGGKDPGAIGQRNTREKDVTLEIAKRLYRRLVRESGITPVMVRHDDTYIPLRDRIQKARDSRADVFVSIHADAFKRKAAHGSSVYTLSLDGASSEAAAWLADSENESDALFGDVNLGGLEQDLRQTLLDLAQNTTMESSLGVGAEVLAELQKIGPVHKPQVEQAAFAVLKSPDIPSILIETAFISNLQEEKKLNSGRFQDTLASAIVQGLKRYLSRRAPAGTVLAANRKSDDDG